MRLFGLANKVYLKKLPDNILMHLCPEEHIQQQLFWYGQYEKPVGMMLKKLLKPDSIFIDVGANIGYFSLMASQSLPQGMVIALEPATDVYESLRSNVALNKSSNIQLIKSAVGERDEECLLYLAGDDNKGMSSFKKPANYSGKTEWVKVLSLDSWFPTSGLTKVDVIKIDVEGNELAVLKGMKQLVLNFQPYLLVELNPVTLSHFGLLPENVLRYVEELSYKPFIIKESGMLTQRIPNRHSGSFDLLLIPATKLTAGGLINNE